MSDSRLHKHPDLPPEAAAAVAHLKPPAVPDHIRRNAQKRSNAGRLPHQQQLAHVGLFLKHVRIQLERLGCAVTLDKTDDGIIFRIGYPSPPEGLPQDRPLLDDVTIGG